MSTQRTLALGLFGSLLFGTAPLAGSEFAERMAAWQSAAPSPQAIGPSQSRIVKSPEQSTAHSPTPGPTSYVPPTHAPNSFSHGPNCPTCGKIDAPFEAGYSGEPMIGPGMYGGCDSCGSCGGCGFCGGCGPCGGCGLLHGLFSCFNPCGNGCCDGGMPCCNTLVWARFEVLMWWRQGRNLPPLATTDPVTVNSDIAGTLPSAQILFGGERVASDMQAGGRFDVGMWCDPRQCFGYGWRFFGLGDDSTDFNIDSLQNPVLAIPFFDNTANANDALLVAFPGLRSGEIDISNSSDIIGNDLYTRFLLCRDCNCRIDFITGWNYSRISDEIAIRSRSTVTGGPLTVGTVRESNDRFEARNDFHGAILGLQWERQCGCWDTRALARMSLGNMHEVVSISGSTQLTVPGQATVTSPGFFATATNSGTFTRDEFTAITEVGLTLAYRWGSCTQLTVGYSFIYWNDIMAAEDAIDTTLDVTNGVTNAQFAFQHSDFWVQGINLGLVRQY